MSVCNVLTYKTMMMVNMKTAMEIMNKNLGTANIVFQYA